MKRTIIAILVLLTVLSVAFATNHIPPTLNNFQQFYGTVSGISATGYKVRATIGTTPVETPIAANGQYGYSPTFKVYGQQNRPTINFFIVNAQGAATPANTTELPYQNMATTRLDFSYTATPGPAFCSNNIREAPEVCDGTDLASKTCLSEVGTGSTGTLRCPANCMTFNTSHHFDITQCTASTAPPPPNVCWDCHDWGACINNAQRRSCVRQEPCDITGTNVHYNEPGEERFCTSTSRTTSTTVPSSCLMNWECGAWSLCRNSQQIRICFRIDNCVTLQSQNPTITVTSIPKPAEERSCQDTVNPPISQQVCSPGLKRCLGPQLQLCSADGTQWATLQNCPANCDPISLTCRVEQIVPPSEPQKPSSMWMYLLAGSVVLILIIVSLSIVLLNKKKYAPAKEYIQESRSRGMDNEQIREKLVEEGWDEKGVGKLFR